MSNNAEQKHNPVGAWQRGGWDSGIQETAFEVLSSNSFIINKTHYKKPWKSGATSQTPSVISGHSDLSAIVSEFSEHLPDFNQQQQQPNQGGVQGQPQLSNQSQEAQAQMQKMLDFQDEEGLQQSIPLLVQYMNMQDQTYCARHVKYCNVLKREQAKNIMPQNRDVIPTIAMVWAN